MSSKKRNRKSAVKTTKLKKILTPRQSIFAEELMKLRSKRQAAITAGCSPKNPDQSANQAFNAIMLKAQEAMGQAGLPLPVVIQKHLVPLLHATEVKLAQHEGQFTDYVELDALGIRLGATRMAFELLGAFPPEDPVLAAKSTVDVIVVDMPEQQWPDAIKVTPSNGNPSQIKDAKPSPPKDPRPKD
jgi:hypothetical protein